MPHLGDFEGSSEIVWTLFTFKYVNTGRIIWNSDIIPKLKLFQIFPLLDATAAQGALLSMFQNYIDKCNVSNSMLIKENYTQQISKSIYHKPNCVKSITQSKSKKLLPQNEMPKSKLHKTNCTNLIA